MITAKEARKLSRNHRKAKAEDFFNNDELGIKIQEAIFDGIKKNQLNTDPINTPFKWKIQLGHQIQEMSDVGGYLYEFGFYMIHDNSKLTVYWDREIP